MKKTIENVVKRWLPFLVEVAIPFIAAPVLPEIWECTPAEAFLVGSCISIYLSLWSVTNQINEGKDAFGSHGKDASSSFETLGERIDNSFSRIDHKLDSLHTFQKFEEELKRIENPYFRKRLMDKLIEELDLFKDKNKSLFDGYVVTHPYHQDTFGVEGLKWTEKELLAVSSIDDYWERDGFSSEYMKTQYDLIKRYPIKIIRIFIASQKHMEQLSVEMLEQHNHGIEVHYIVSDAGFCPEEWKKEAFLVQDRRLLVDMKEINSHKPGDLGREIITIRESNVNDKLKLFDKILHASRKFTTEQEKAGV